MAMKQLITSIFLIGICAFPVSAETTLPAPDVVKINDRIYALLGPTELPNKTNRGYMVNTALIIGEKGAILVDTGFSTEIGKHIKQAVAAITDKPVTHIINTHDHGDHSLGNAAFQNSVIISSARCKTAMKTTSYEWMDLLKNITGQAQPDTHPVLPTQTYPENTKSSLTIHGVNLVIWVPHGSHTTNDLMVYLPDDKVLVAGDILTNTVMPSFRDASVKNWIATLDEITKMNLTSIVPGHGPLMSISEVKELKTEMSKFYAAIETGYNNDLVDSEIRKTLDLSYWKKLKFFDDLMGTNINRAYLEIENENF